jgi:hypothetical protein
VNARVLHHLHLHSSVSIVCTSTPPPLHIHRLLLNPIPNVLIFSSSHLRKVLDLRNARHPVTIPCGSSKVNMQGWWLF